MLLLNKLFINTNYESSRLVNTFIAYRKLSQSACFVHRCFLSREGNNYFKGDRTTH